jgi:hypothetical protein
MDTHFDMLCDALPGYESWKFKVRVSKFAFFVHGQLIQSWSLVRSIHWKWFSLMKRFVRITFNFLYLFLISHGWKVPHFCHLCVSFEVIWVLPVCMIKPIYIIWTYVTFNNSHGGKIHATLLIALVTARVVIASKKMSRELIYFRVTEHWGEI